MATLAYVGLALAAGLWTHSLALVSEAGHNLADFLTLALSGFAVYLQGKPGSSRISYGYHRAGVLAAFLNLLLLAGLSVGILIAAFARMRHPAAIATGGMLWVGAIGLAMNACIAGALERGRHDVNIRAAFLHMVGDAVSTALLIVAALAIRWTGRLFWDPVLAVVIVGLILWSSWDVWRETVTILLEGTPRRLNPLEVEAALSSLAGVRAVHDLHVWSLGSLTHALSCHIAIADIPPSQSRAILNQAQEMLARRFGIRHSTIQFENEICREPEDCGLRAMPRAH